jgi:hypothetical protein
VSILWQWLRILLFLSGLAEIFVWLHETTRRHFRKGVNELIQSTLSHAVTPSLILISSFFLRLRLQRIFFNRGPLPNFCFAPSAYHNRPTNRYRPCSLLTQCQQPPLPRPHTSAFCMGAAFSQNGNCIRWINSSAVFFLCERNKWSDLPHSSPSESWSVPHMTEAEVITPCYGRRVCIVNGFTGDSTRLAANESRF